MAMKDTHDLLLHEMKDIYFAEKQLVKALSRLEDQSITEELAQLYGQHRAETEEQIKRLEQAFEILGEQAEEEPCPGMMGLLTERSNFISKERPSAMVRTVFDIGASIKVELYEIAAYEGMIRIAAEHGHDEVFALLEQNLLEERKALSNLTALAEAYSDESFLYELSGEPGQTSVEG